MPPRAYGGSELIVYNLAIELQKRGHEVVTAACKSSQIRPLVETVEPSMGVAHDWLQKEEEAYKIWKPVAENWKPDIIHGHDWFGYEYLYKQEHPETKVLHTHHGEMAWNSLPSVKYPNLVGISYDHARRVSLRLGVPVLTAYNGIDLNLYPYNEKHGDYLLFLSRIDPIKAPHFAIDAARRLRMKLIVAGGDSFVIDQRYVMNIIEMCRSTPHLCSYLGEVPFQKKVELLQNARALLFCPAQPFNEPFGLVPLEAAACGTPTIALRNGATPEVVKDGVSGFVVDDVVGMVQAVRDKLDSIKPQDCRDQAMQFSREAMASRYEELYRQETEW